MYPETWDTKTLSEIVDYKSGRTPSRSNKEFWQKTSSNIPWVAISDMEQYGTITKTNESISLQAFGTVFKERIVPAGTLLMSFKLTIGRISTLAVPACHNEAIISIYPQPNIDQRYLGYFLSQLDFNNLQDRQVKGNTLNQEKIDRILIAVPPFEEQKEIASILDLVRSSIETQIKAISVTQELKRATMQKLFTQGLRREVQIQTEIGLLPESWNVEQLGQNYNVASGGTPSRSISSYWIKGTIPWVKTTEVGYCTINDTEEKITSNGLRNSAAKIFPVGTLLMAMYGQGVTRGKVAILGIEAACNQACAAMNSKNENIEPKFLFYFLTYRYEKIRQLAHGGQQQNLNLDIIKDLLIAFPTNEEDQQEIVKILDAIDQKIDVHKRRKHILEELFKSLLHKLMTGEIRASDFNMTALGKGDTA